MASYSYDEPDPKIGTVEESDRSRTTFTSGTAPDISSTRDICTVSAVKLGSVVAVVSVVIAMDEIPRSCASAVSGFQMQLTLAEKNSQAARNIIESLVEELAYVKEQLKTDKSATKSNSESAVGGFQMQMTLSEKNNEAAGNKIKSLLEELVIIKEQLKTAESAKNTYISELNQKDKAYRAEISLGKALMVELMQSDRKRQEAEADVQFLNEQIDKLRNELNQRHTTNEVAKVNHNNMERQLGEADFRSRNQQLEIEYLKVWLAVSGICVFIFALIIVCCCCTPAGRKGNMRSIGNG